MIGIFEINIVKLLHQFLMLWLCVKICLASILNQAFDVWVLITEQRVYHLYPWSIPRALRKGSSDKLHSLQIHFLGVCKIIMVIFAKEELMLQGSS